jgi:hypothetical protein
MSTMRLFANPTHEDGAVIAAVAAESASFDPDDYTSDAEDELCRNARRIVDSLDFDISEKVWPWNASTPACMIDFEAKEAGLLLVLAFDDGQPSETRIGAMNELRRRYLKGLEDDAREIAHRLMHEAHPEIAVCAQLAEEHQS